MEDFARALRHIRQMRDYGAPVDRMVKTMSVTHGVSPTETWLLLRATEVLDKDKPWWESAYE